MRSSCCVFVLGTLVACLGCGSSGPELGDISGTVTYQDQPLESGTIIFEVPGARPASGSIVGGQITEVTTFEPGDGVPVGQAKIAVFANSSAGGNAAPATPAAPVTPDQSTTLAAGYMGSGSSLIPEKYNTPATSGLTAEIEPGENRLQLDLLP